jgi:hypothetical protein
MKKRANLSKMIPYVLCGSMLMFVAACGSDDDDDGGGVGNIPQEQQQEDQGIYRATLGPLNGSVAGSPSGTATFTIIGDEVVANVDMEGVPADITHAQHVHLADSCPTAAADTNGDGFVDVLEGVPAYGPILVPLDGDIESQSAGMNGFPSADSDGSYNWTETGSLSRMLEDLRAEDENPEDATAKLPEGEQLNLAGRHVVIHGVPQSTTLPDSVATIGDLPAHATLPIACGVIERVIGQEEDTQTTGGTTAGEGQTTGGTTGETTTGGTTGETTTGGTTGETTTGGTTGETTTGGTTGETTTGGTTGETTTGGTTGETTTGGTTGA